jgi:hypothetical protein
MSTIIGDLSTWEREARSLPYEHEPAVAPMLGFGMLFRPGKTQADQDFPVPNDFVHKTQPASSTHHNNKIPHTFRTLVAGGAFVVVLVREGGALRFFG